MTPATKAQALRLVREALAEFAAASAANPLVKLGWPVEVHTEPCRVDPGVPGLAFTWKGHQGETATRIFLYN